MLEMLIAITLLSVLTVGFFMALRIGLNAMERTSVRMDENRRMVGVERTLDRQIAGIVPAMAGCGGFRRSPIFVGSPTSMRMITTHSLADAGRGLPQLIEYLIVPGQLPGSLRLVVNEMPYSGPASVAGLCGGNQPISTVGANSFILADHLAAARFTYLYENGFRMAHEWRPEWLYVQGTTPGSALPAAIRIEMASLASEPAHMRFSPVTLRVHVNRMPGDEYIYDDVEPVRIIQ
jgi:hypothetical protein